MGLIEWLFGGPKVDNSIQVTKSGATEGLKIIYGVTKVEPVSVFKFVSTDNVSVTSANHDDMHEPNYTSASNRATIERKYEGKRDNYDWLYRIDTWGIGPIDSIRTIWIDGKNSNMKGFNKRPYFRMHHFYGRADQATMPELTRVSKWTAAHIGKGVAYSVNRFYHSHKKPKFKNEPKVEALIKGIKVYDPRKIAQDASNPDTWTYSANKALVALNYLMADYGLGAKADEIEFESWKAAAEYCDTQLLDIPDVLVNDTTAIIPNVYDRNLDEFIDLAIGQRWPNYRVEQTQGQTTMQRYETHISIDPKISVVENMRSLLRGFGWSMPWSNGQHKLVIEQEVTAPVLFFDEDDIIGPWSIDYDSRKGRLNQLTVEFRNRNKSYAQDAVSWPEYSEVSTDLYQVYLAEDQDHELHSRESVDSISDHYVAQAYAEYMVRKSRIGLRINGLKLAPKAILLDPGDVISITCADHGFDNKWFIVENISFGEDLISTVNLVGYDARVYGADIAQEPLRRPEEEVDLFQDPPAVPLMTIAGYEKLNSDGTAVKGLQISWTKPTETIGFDSYDIYYRIYNAANDAIEDERDQTPYTGHVSVSADYNSTIITGLQDQETYDVRISYRSKQGVESDPLVETVYLDPVTSQIYATTADNVNWSGVVDDDGNRPADGADVTDYALIAATYVDQVTHGAAVTDLQNQIDGNITSWFYDVPPSLTSEPYTLWANDTERDRHIGDTYTDKSTGNSYRFIKDGAVYSWWQITDTDTQAALDAAALAQDTADGKRRVFVATPSGPYDIGDLWDTGTGIKRATADRATGYLASEWTTVADINPTDLADLDTDAATDLEEATREAVTNPFQFTSLGKGYRWGFAGGDTGGWTLTNGTLTTSTWRGQGPKAGSINLAAISADLYLHKTLAETFNGDDAPHILVRVKCNTTQTGFFQLFYRTVESSTLASLTLPTKTYTAGEVYTIRFDLTADTRWTSQTINFLRIDFPQDGLGNWDVDAINIGYNSAEADVTSEAFNDLDLSDLDSIRSGKLDGVEEGATNTGEVNLAAEFSWPNQKSVIEPYVVTLSSTDRFRTSSFVAINALGLDWGETVTFSLSMRNPSATATNFYVRVQAYNNSGSFVDISDARASANSSGNSTVRTYTTFTIPNDTATLRLLIGVSGTAPSASYRFSKPMLVQGAIDRPYRFNGTVGADSNNLRVGLGVNRLKNSRFINGISKWAKGGTNDPAGHGNHGIHWRDGTAEADDWAPAGEGALSFQQNDGLNSDGTNYIYDVYYPDYHLIEPNKYYEFSAYCGWHRCQGHLKIWWYNSSKVYITESGSSLSSNPASRLGGHALENYDRMGFITQAPSNARFCRVGVRKYETFNDGSSTSSYLFLVRPYFGQASAGQTELSNWVEGPEDYSTIEGAANIANDSIYPPGIAYGAAGTIRLVKNSNGSLTEDSSPGEIGVSAGVLYRPNGSKETITGAFQLATHFEGSFYKTGFVILGSTGTSVRFGSTFDGSNNWFTAIYENEQWTAVDNGGERFNFTPAADDVVLARIRSIVGGNTGIDYLESFITHSDLTDYADTRVANSHINIGGVNLIKKSYFISFYGGASLVSSGMANSFSGWGLKIAKAGTINAVAMTSYKPWPKGEDISVSFIAWTSTGSVQLRTDFFPDTLPEKAVILNTTPTRYTWEGINSSHSDMDYAALRWFCTDHSGTRDIFITDIQLEYGNKASRWTPPLDDDEHLRLMGYQGDLNATYGADSSNLRVGNASNLLRNSKFKRHIRPWAKGWSSDPASNFDVGFNLAGSTYHLLNEGSVVLHDYKGNSGIGYVYDMQYDRSGWGIPVDPNKRYEFSARVGLHRAEGYLIIAWYNSAGGFITHKAGTFIPADVNGGKSGGTLLDSFAHVVTFDTAPAGARFAKPFLRKSETLTGYTDSWALLCRAYFGEAHAGQVDGASFTEGSIDEDDLDVLELSNNSHVRNSLIAENGVNRVRYSRFEAGFTGWYFHNSNGLASDNYTGTYEGRGYGRHYFASTAANQTTSISMQRFPVTNGERLAVQFWAQKGGEQEARCHIWWYDKDGNVLHNNFVVQVTASGGGHNLWQAFVTVPSSAIEGRLEWYVTSTAASQHMYLVLSDVMVSGAGPDQTVFPPFSPGPDGAIGADVTDYADNRISNVNALLSNQHSNLVKVPNPVDTINHFWTSGHVSLQSGQPITQLPAAEYIIHSNNKRDTYEEVWTPCQSGEVIFVAGWVYAAAANYACLIGVHTDDGTDGSNNRWHLGASVAAGTVGWQFVSGFVTLPATAKRMRPFLQMSGPNGSTGQGYWSGIYVSRGAFNADNTSQNTAADTSRVNGVAASTIRDGTDRALIALDTNSRVRDARRLPAQVAAGISGNITRTSNGSSVVLASSDAGTSATITAYACSFQFGSSLAVAYNQASKTGLSFNTYYHCYYVDTSFSGGTKTLQIATTRAAATVDGAVYLGVIKTPADGGSSSSGSSGGSGNSGGGSYPGTAIP